VVVIPEKQQFMDGESFYTNLLHEMSHSTGSENRLNRIKPGQNFGSTEYAREELVAELTAALVSSQYGMSKHVKSDSAAYLKSWLNHLHQDPSFIKTTLMDVKRSSSFIGQRIDAVNMRLERDGITADFSDIREQNKTMSAAFTNKPIQKPAQQESQEEKQEQGEQQQQSEQLKPKEQEQEVAARAVNTPRFHR